MLLAVVYSVYYCRQILTKLYFFRRVVEMTQIPNFMKIRPVIAELLQADGRTDGQTAADMRKLTVGFRLKIHKYFAHFVSAVAIAPKSTVS